MASENVATLNRQLAQKLLDEAKNNPPLRMQASSSASQRPDRCSGDDWDDLARRLDQAEPDPNKTFGVEVGETIPKST